MTDLQISTLRGELLPPLPGRGSNGGRRYEERVRRVLESSRLTGPPCDRPASGLTSASPTTETD